MINTECGIFKTSYRADHAIHRSPPARYAIMFLLLVVLAIIPLVAPWIGGNYLLSIANQVGIMIVGAVGLNILVGYTGQISLGHGAFICVGAYTAGVLASRWDVPFWIALPASGVLAAAVGSIFAIPALRVKGLYLAIATLAAQFIISWTLLHATTFITGTKSLTAVLVPDAAIGGLTFGNDRSKYYLIFIVGIVLIMAAENLFRTRVGRALVAIRDRDIAAEVMGVNIHGYKVMAFAISSFYAGITGALFAYYTNAVSAEMFDIRMSILYLAIVIIGGLGSIPGSILGAIFMTLLPIVLRDSFAAVRESIPQLMLLQSFLTDIIFGLVIIIFLIFEPEGLYKIWRNIKDYFRVWPFSY